MWCAMRYINSTWDGPIRLRRRNIGEQVLVHSFDPRNTTLEPEYYGDVDAAKYAERKPLIWFWMMFDRSPAGLNHWLGYRVRAHAGAAYLQTHWERT